MLGISRATPVSYTHLDQAKQKVREILTGHKVPPLDRDLLKEMDTIMLKARRDILG